MDCPSCKRDIEPVNDQCPYCQFDIEREISTDSLPKTNEEEATSSVDEAFIKEISKTWRSITGTEPQGQSIREIATEIKTPSGITLHKRDVIESKGKEEKTEFDYEIDKLIGKGGMGLIYSAQQASLNRRIAIKRIKGDRTANKEDLFISEAITLGDLDHPNIVPIHELGMDNQGDLFYSMKEVTGTNWDEIMGENTLLQNLELLHRVCDAVAFAHSRDIIHRDIKPENIRLGEFGAIYVMDWGLAASVSESGKAQMLGENGSSGGTPSYMAPEMGAGEIELIGKRSDVYLLGATLFEIITRVPPHKGSDTFQRIFNVVHNNIRDINDSEKGELLDIALKAMETDPEDRFESVLAFQEALDGYLEHFESIRLTEESKSRMRSARNYEDYASIIFGLQEAIRIWDGNRNAKNELERAQLGLATLAFQEGDFKYATSLLSNKSETHKDLLRNIRNYSFFKHRFFKLRATKIVFKWLMGCMILTAAVLLMASYDRIGSGKDPNRFQFNDVLLTFLMISFILSVVMAYCAGYQHRKKAEG